MKKKYAGMPLWAWGLIGAAAVYWYWRRASSSSSPAAVTPTSTVLDPNAVDPTTGLTYGQEESAALNQMGAANAPGALSSGGGGGYLDTTGTTPTGVDSFDQNLTNLMDLMSALNLQPASAPAPPPVAQTVSAPITTPVTAPVNASAPTTAPSVNYPQTASMASLAQNNSVLGQIRSLTGSGFHKIAGTTQQGGLPQTGTYVYKQPKLNRGGATLHTGPTKYFVWGTQQTGYHIRAA